MKIVIETLPHKHQRYETVGDWYRDGKGTLHIKVSETDNDLFNILVGLHELVEVIQCEQLGISDEVVTAFDRNFERERALGQHDELAEPGDSPSAPYNKQHIFATQIERDVADQLGVKWNEYESAINSL